MMNGELLTKTLGFRVTDAMWAEVEAHRLARKLRKPSDAAREILERGLDPIAATAAEARACGIDPVAAIKTAIAQKP